MYRTALTRTQVEVVVGKEVVDAVDRHKDRTCEVVGGERYLDTALGSNNLRSDICCGVVQLVLLTEEVVVGVDAVANSEA